MLARFSLAILFAVLVAASRPLATGGHHDLLAVGVRWEETVGDGKVVERLSLAPPTGRALEVYDALLRTSARNALLQGSTAFVPAPAGAPAEGRRIRELVYYGVRSRPGRAPVVFGDPAGDAPAAFVAAHAAARDLASLPPTVTEAAARVLLPTPDDAAFRDALEALSGVRTDGASAAALETALASRPGTSTARRVIAIRVLRRLGGARAYPDAFRRLRESDDPRVREEASE